MLSVFRWFLVSLAVVILTACGGGGSGGGEQQSVSQQGSGNSGSDSSGGGNNSSNPVGSNNETYIDNNGDIVPVLSEKPDVLDIDIDDGDQLKIRIMRNINLNSDFAKSELSSYSDPTKILVRNYTNVAVDIDVKCEDYGFDQSDLDFSKTFENGIKFKLYIKTKAYIDNTHYSVSCYENDYESVPSYSGLAGEYTIIQSDILRFGSI